MLANRANTRAWERFSAAFGVGERASEMIALAEEKALSVGLTTLHALEGGNTSEDVTITDLLIAMPKLRLRLLLYYQTMDVEMVVRLGRVHQQLKGSFSAIILEAATLQRLDLLQYRLLTLNGEG